MALALPCISLGFSNPKKLVINAGDVDVIKLRVWPFFGFTFSTGKQILAIGTKSHFEGSSSLVKTGTTGSTGLLLVTLLTSHSIRQ